MSDSVKMVFKSLLGTRLFMVMTSVFIELFNINITGLQVRHMAKMAARQAAELFTQESYKIDNGAGTIKADDIKNIDGGTYISGEFYGNLADMYEIYDSIYGKGSQFEKWCNASDGSTFSVDRATYYIEKTPRGSLINSYTNLKAMKIGVNHEYNSYLTQANKPRWEDDEESDKVKNWNLYSRGKAYYELCYTPINLGIPYLDSTITNRMYQWNLARLASNCDPDLIQTEDIHTYNDLYKDPYVNSKDYFINYKGFKIYADRAEITEYEYNVYDLTKQEDRDAYRKLTNNKVDVGENSIHTNDKTSNKFEDEDNFVAVVSITYGVPVEYIGITPIRTIFNWVWNREVEGITRTNGSKQGTDGALIKDRNNIHEQWNSESKDMRGLSTTDYSKYQNGVNNGGSGDDLLDNTLFTTGYLTYSIVN